MAASSSTSSSDAAAFTGRGPPRHAPMGVPWALGLALLIVAAFEAVLHTRPALSLVAYDSDEGQYHAVRDTVEAQGAAEVALVGSSQMRDGVVMPVLQAALDKKAGRHVAVANYGTRGARADVMDAVVRFLQRRPTPPALIVVGLSARDLRAVDRDWPRVAIFWTPGDWWHAFRRFGWRTTEALPTVIRTEVGHALRSLRYREEIALTLKRALERFGVNGREEGNPILGEVTTPLRGSLGLRTLARPLVAVHRQLDRVADNYLLSRPARPTAAMRLALHDLVADFAARPSTGLLVQMPVAVYLQDLLDRRGLGKVFQAAIAQEAAAARVPYLPVRVQGPPPPPAMFSDLQHFNNAGATAYAEWLAGRIAERLATTQSSHSPNDRPRSGSDGTR